MIVQAHIKRVNDIYNALLRNQRVIGHVPVEYRNECMNNAFVTFAQSVNPSATMLDSWINVIGSLHCQIPAYGVFINVQESILDEMKCELDHERSNSNWQMSLLSLTATFLYVGQVEAMSAIRNVSLVRRNHKLHAIRKCQACWSHRKNVIADRTAFIGSGEASINRDYCYGCIEALRMIDPSLIAYSDRIDDPNDCGFMETRDEC